MVSTESLQQIVANLRICMIFHMPMIIPMGMLMLVFMTVPMPVPMPTLLLNMPMLSLMNAPSHICLFFFVSLPNHMGAMVVSIVVTMGMAMSVFMPGSVPMFTQRRISIFVLLFMPRPMLVASDFGPVRISVLIMPMFVLMPVCLVPMCMAMPMAMPLVSMSMLVIMGFVSMSMPILDLCGFRCARQVLLGSAPLVRRIETVLAKRILRFALRAHVENVVELIPIPLMMTHADFLSRQLALSRYNKPEAAVAVHLLNAPFRIDFLTEGRCNR